MIERQSVGRQLTGKNEQFYKWGFKNELQQILLPTLSKSDVQTSNKYITTNRIIIYDYKDAN